MRRFTAVLLALALCGAGASLAVLTAPHARPCLGHARLASLAGRVPALRFLQALRSLRPGVALASETLRFRPVSPESADGPTRHRVRATTPMVTPAPEPPGAPVSPEVTQPTEPTKPTQVVKSGDIMRVGSDIHVGRDEVVRGSVSAIGGDVTVDGHVEGDVSAIRGDVYLGSSARVDGDVVSAGGQIHEEPGAIVGGQRVTAIPGSRLKRIRRLAQEETGEHVAGVMAAMVWLIIMLGMGWAIAQLAPARTVAAVETLQRAPLLSFGIGAMILALIIPSLIALSLVVAFLCITIIGIPLALAALLGYGLFFAVFGVWGYVVGAGAIGSLILRRRAALATAPGAVVDPGSPAGISRAVVAGVLVMTGSLVFGSLVHSSPMMGPLRVLGGLAFILAIITMALSSLAGGGAWLRSEFQTGTLGRWWHRRKLPAVKPAASAAAPAPPTPPAPPAAPAPPSSYAPPATPGPEAPPSLYAPPPADPPAPPPTG